MENYPSPLKKEVKGHSLIPEVERKTREEESRSLSDSCLTREKQRRGIKESV
jgi:hypothetical protein